MTDNAAQQREAEWTLRYAYMRRPDAALQLVLFGAWTMFCLRSIDAFCLLGSAVMRKAVENY